MGKILNFLAIQIVLCYFLNRNIQLRKAWVQIWGRVSLNETWEKSKKTEEKQPGAEALDQLTAVLKKDAAEMRINAAMAGNRHGILFLCDVNGMKRINEQHGHLMGDECLKQAAKILSYMIRSGDILGRYGGDEFLIYMPGCKEVQQAQEICRRMENRFRANGGKVRRGLSVTVTVVWTLRQPGDTLQRLLGRVEADLGERKEGAGRQDQRKDHYSQDVRQVRKELIEQISRPGAYCQDYETFKSIYRFLERGIIRSGQKACVILLTVVDERGRSLLPHKKDIRMKQLGEDIGATLRIGDVYTRYSSSQYLLLVIDTTEGQADRIVGRIREQYLARGQEHDILVHHCYELQPAQVGLQKAQ